MLRRYFPEWLKSEPVEFMLECLAFLALFGVMLYQVMEAIL